MAWNFQRGEPRRHNAFALILLLAGGRRSEVRSHAAPTVTASTARPRVLAVVVTAAVVIGGLTLHLAHRRAAVPGLSGDGGGGLRGTVGEPTARPDFTLLDTDGRPFDFRAETEGRLALLFFGYTHCPDVCPVHLAGLADVLQDLPPEDRSRVRVIFVTVDPARDTAERMRQWLDSFDPRFTGLRGTIHEVNEVLATLSLPPAVLAGPGEDGRYDVGHAAAVLAFGPEGPLRASYPFGTRQMDWAHDIPELLRGRARSSGSLGRFEGGL